MRVVFRSLLFLAILSFATRAGAAERQADVIVVGSGIAGLSAALEAARTGAHVLVIDMASVFGGHAVMSEGGVNIVRSPLHEAKNVPDTSEIAYADFVRWGEDVNKDWVRYYVDHSRREVHDWLVSLGVVFENLRQTPGNSVPRFHETRGRGLGLVGPIYRACLQSPNIRFLWNTRVGSLLTTREAVTGVATENLRTGEKRDYRAAAVVLATGGFQNNPELLRQYWPKEYPFPPRLLLGSGVNSKGSGLTMATAVGAAVSHPDYQWNYPYGLPDPRDPTRLRGLNARNTGGIWVNAAGERFVNEIQSAKVTLPAIVRQPRSTYWTIFDADAKPFFYVAGTDWTPVAIDRLIFGNPELVVSAGSVAELASRIGLPAARLTQTIERYNQLVAKGDDPDFQRFGPSSLPFARELTAVRTPPRVIAKPPFYAVQMYPMTRKSNGGLGIDLSGRVLNAGRAPIPGLYAAGEATGSAGINGKAGLEGVWLGPGVATGRVAGRAAATHGRGHADQILPPSPSGSTRKITGDKSCVACHDLGQLVGQNRTGFWHFEQVHRAVLETNKSCVQCHAELTPNADRPHAIDRLVQVVACASCHGQ
jgi:predicted oxidoreductase